MRISGTEITVDVDLCQPGIFQRALGDLGVKLCGGFIGCVPGRMFINSSNVSPAPDGQIVLRLRFLFLRVFSPVWAIVASAENIPSDETGTTARSHGAMRPSCN
jgi:hypothetical protein